MSEVIMVLEEPWYNTLTEQMFEQVIEEMEEGTCHCQLYVKIKE